MQEEVENRTVSLSVSATKLTGRVLREAIAKYLNHRKAVKAGRQYDSSVSPQGKQTVKQLGEQGQGVSNIEQPNLRVRSFDRVARKYGVDYAIRKDNSTDPPKYQIFFKGKDADAITAAFQEYSAKEIRRESKKKPSVLAKLHRFTELVRGQSKDKVKNKEKELEL